MQSRAEGRVEGSAGRNSREEAPMGDASLQPIWLIVAVPASLILMSSVALVSSLSLGYWVKLGPGPGFFPFWIAVVTIASSTFWLLNTLRSRKPKTPVGGDLALEAAGGDSPPRSLLGRHRTLVVVLSLAALAALLNVLGYQLGMFLFLMFHMRFLGRQTWIISSVISACGSFGVYYLFTGALRVPLPTSSLDSLIFFGL